MSDPHDVPERDRLPVMEWLTYTFEDEVTDVILQLSETWPDVTVRILPRARGVEIRGVVHPDGRIQSLTIEAYCEDEENYSEQGEVTASAARSLAAVVTALKEWNAIARDMAAQKLERGEDARTVVDAKRATESLRALLYGLPRGAQGTRKRGADAELMLRQVAEAYTAALADGDPTPRKTVASLFGYTPEHISRLLKRARQPRNGRPPLLGPDEGRRARTLAQQPVVAAIVTSAKGVLITERRDGVPPYGFVSGEVEPGELAEDAAVREVKEETGLEVRTGDEIGRRVHPKTQRTMIYLAAVPVRGTKVIIGDESELTDVRWVGLYEALRLMPDMFPPVRDYLTRELDGVAP